MIMLLKVGHYVLKINKKHVRKPKCVRFYKLHLEAKCFAHINYIFRETSNRRKKLYRRKNVSIGL